MPAPVEAHAAPEPPAVVCGVCGTTAAGPPLGWSLSRDRGRTTATCGDCTRLHVRSMEAKLEQEHW